MARHRARKHRWNPYTSEVQRFSVYPPIQKPREEGPRVGDEVTLTVRDVDEKGRGYASYMGRRVIIYNASLGSKIRARIVKITGDTLYAEITQTLSDSDVEY